ncbi:MAG: cupin domain-containing protein [Draconibacterium sp.]|nr:cupin domain-containing protein [Draconibacterium sp.]
MNTSSYWIKNLDLQKHPEGGWYKEVYRSGEVIPGGSIQPTFTEDRNCSTSIYYLLERKDFSSFHRIKSDEIWHYYEGTSSVEIVSIEENKIRIQKLGNNPEKEESFQVLVKANTWFAARLNNKEGFALTGCTVSPGFHFDDFEMADENLLNEFPHLNKEIIELLRK